MAAAGGPIQHDVLSSPDARLGRGGDIPPRSSGAFIAPYWGDFDPAGIHCGNVAGEIRWRVFSDGAFVLEFRDVKNCGGGSGTTDQIASWQLILRNHTTTFEIALDYARGNSGTHLIGWQNWDGSDSIQICRGDGAMKCFREKTVYTIEPTTPSYDCHANARCTTAAGRAHATPRYAGCECDQCFIGDGLSRCDDAGHGCGESTGAFPYNP